MTPFDCPPAAGAQDRLRQAQGAVVIEGYAAVFDRVDRAGDVIRAGAFGAVGPAPLLWGHRGGPVGVVEAIGEDAFGLRVRARVEDVAVATAVRSGALAGLSVGYVPRRVRQAGRRELLGVELREVSLVRVPMQALARIDHVTPA